MTTTLTRRSGRAWRPAPDGSKAPRCGAGTCSALGSAARTLEDFVGPVMGIAESLGGSFFYRFAAHGRL